MDEEGIPVEISGVHPTRTATVSPDIDVGGNQNQSYDGATSDFFHTLDCEPDARSSLDSGSAPGNLPYL